MECAAWVRVLLHYLAVPQALFSVLGEAFPCVLEERELGVQLAFDEDALATINFRGRQDSPACVGVDAQEVSYLVRPAKRWNDNTDGRPKCKGE
jgi:hypothetical protein